MNKDVKDLFDSAAKLWLEQGERKDFRAMIDTAIGSYITFRAMSDAEGAREAALGTIQHAIEMLDKGAGTAIPSVAGDRSCSFCGQSPPKVRLGYGPNVSICNECVEIFGERFSNKPL